ncbi:MAG TPA: PDZ domain-containing protein, partial [Azoarcus sp.]|nr:PDZ domain-containing protein [Azoarcus sp.]
EGERIANWLKHAVHDTTDLPLASLLAPFGVEYQTQAASTAPGLRVRMAPGAEPKIAVAYENGAAQNAGLSAGDVLVAFDGIQVTGTNLNAMLERRQAGDTIRIHAFRRDELMEFDVVLDAPPRNVVKLSFQTHDAAHTALRNGWLGR